MQAGKLRQMEQGLEHVQVSPEFKLGHTHLCRGIVLTAFCMRDQSCKPKEWKA